MHISAIYTAVRHHASDMRVTLPIEELKPGMFVDSVHKQKSGAEVKIKSRGMVRDEAIIARLAANGVVELNIDFAQSDIPVPEKYQAPEVKPDTSEAKPNEKQAQDKPAKAAKAQPTKDKEISLEDEFANAARQFEQHNKQLQMLYGNLTAGMQVDMTLINDISQEIVGSVLRNTNAMAILTRIKDKEGFNWRHMINCAILVTVFAKYLGLGKKVIEQMAIGAMLHDVGHTKIPQGIIDKNGPLNKLEMKTMQRHVAQSLGLTRDAPGITPLMLDMIVSHHERLDGSGYPRRLQGMQISKAARIMAIVDVYEGMTAERPHRDGDEPLVALRYLLANKAQFDPVLVQHFIKCIGVHPVGTIVKLSNERLALVLEGNRGAPTAPKVRVFYNTKHMHHITAKDIDLNEQDKIKIASTVRPLDYQINLSRLLKDHLLV